MLACLVDASTGMVLASRKDQDDISLPTAAAGAADIANVLSQLTGELPVGESTSGPNHRASGPGGSAGSVTHTPAWIRRPTHSIASYSARPQVQARSWTERAPSIAHATAHCSRLSTAEA